MFHDDMAIYKMKGYMMENVKFPVIGGWEMTQGRTATRTLVGALESEAPRFTPSSILFIFIDFVPYNKNLPFLSSVQVHLHSSSLYHLLVIVRRGYSWSSFQ